MSNPSPDEHRAENSPALHHWLASEQGHYVLNWEQKKIAPLVSDAFGFNAIQIGLPEIDFLAENRMPLKLRLGDARQMVTSGVTRQASDRVWVDLICELPELPLASNSIDLVVLTHALDFHAHPHQLLREIERVLMPEGKVIIAGFNPFSLWGLRRHLPRCSPEGPWHGQFISLPRLKDWLALLNLETDRGHFGCYAPPFARTEWINRFGWMEKAGDRWWPAAAGVYIIRAVKRVHGMRLIKPNWKTASAPNKAFTTAVRKLRPHD